MFRRILLIAAWTIVGGALALCAVYWTVGRYTPEELAGAEVKASFDGRETRAELTAAGATYIVVLSIAPPPNADDDKLDEWDCRLASPGPVDETCSSKGHGAGRVSTELTIRDGTRIVLSSRNMPFWSWKLGLGRRTEIQRQLAKFEAQRGHHYVLAAKFNSNDAELRSMNPRLQAYISSDYLEGESILDGFTIIVAGTALFFAGLLAFVTYRRSKRRPSGSTGN